MATAEEYAPVSLNGYLWKKGLLGWRRRFFVLSGLRLSSYSDDTCRKHKGSLTITEDGSLEEIDTREYSFRLACAGKSLRAAAESMQEMAAWRHRLEEAIMIAAEQAALARGVPRQLSAQFSHASANASSDTSHLTDIRDAHLSTSSPRDAGGQEILPAPVQAFGDREVCGTHFTIDGRYQQLQPVGQGAFGVVVSAYDTLTTRKVAVKRVDFIMEDVQDAKRVVRELRLLRILEHRNIIRLRNASMGPATATEAEFTHIFLITDYMDTNLHRVIYSRQQLSDQHMKYIAYQILCGLKYLHSAGIIHRDIKPGNVLVNAHCEVKLCDFGLSRQKKIQGMPEPMTEYVITRWYRAPEVMLASGFYGTSVDMWGVGCVLAEMARRKPLFRGENYLDQLRRMFRVIGKPSIDDVPFVRAARPRRFIEELPETSRVDLRLVIPVLQGSTATEKPTTTFSESETAQRRDTTERSQTSSLAMRRSGRQHSRRFRGNRVAAEIPEHTEPVEAMADSTASRSSASSVSRRSQVAPAPPEGEPISIAASNSNTASPGTTDRQGAGDSAQRGTRAGMSPGDSVSHGAYSEHNVQLPPATTAYVPHTARDVAAHTVATRGGNVDAYADVSNQPQARYPVPSAASGTQPLFGGEMNEQCHDRDAAAECSTTAATVEQGALEPTQPARSSSADDEQNLHVQTAGAGGPGRRRHLGPYVPNHVSGDSPSTARSRPRSAPNTHVGAGRAGHLDPIALELLDGMLVLDPGKRMTVQTALQHSYFDQFRDRRAETTCRRPINLGDIERCSTKNGLRPLIFNEIGLCRHRLQRDDERALRRRAQRVATERSSRTPSTRDDGISLADSSQNAGPTESVLGDDASISDAPPRSNGQQQQQQQLQKRQDEQAGELQVPQGRQYQSSGANDERTWNASHESVSDHGHSSDTNRHIHGFTRDRDNRMAQHASSEKTGRSADLATTTKHDGPPPQLSGGEQSQLPHRVVAQSEGTNQHGAAGVGGEPGRSGHLSQLDSLHRGDSINSIATSTSSHAVGTEETHLADLPPNGLIGHVRTHDEELLGRNTALEKEYRQLDQTAYRRSHSAGDSGDAEEEPFPQPDTAAVPPPDGNPPAVYRATSTARCGCPDPVDSSADLRASPVETVMGSASFKTASGGEDIPDCVRVADGESGKSGYVHQDVMECASRDTLLSQEQTPARMSGLSGMYAALTPPNQSAGDCLSLSEDQRVAAKQSALQVAGNRLLDNSVR